MLATMDGVAAYNVREVLNACRELEVGMAGFYDMLAKVHADVPHMARLWTKTANEERNHASQFDLVLDISKGSVETVRVDLASVERARRAVEMLCQECVTRPPTMEQALRAAIAFEEALVRIHADAVPVFADDSHKKLFGAMMSADRGHVDRLRKALAFGPSTPTPTPMPVVRLNRK
jgi:rubrerythrin